MNKIQEIAKRRLESIEYATQRIKRKIEQNPHREADYETRLKEFEVSKWALELELKNGIPIKIKDKKQMAVIKATGGVVPPTEGTVIHVPAGELAMEGK